MQSESESHATTITLRNGTHIPDCDERVLKYCRVLTTYGGLVRDRVTLGA